MPSYRVLPSLSLLVFLSSLFTTLRTATSGLSNGWYWYNCSIISNFTTHSTYKSNLQFLLTSLSSDAIPTGFSAQSNGQPPNQVFVSALCRGDVSQDDCRSCLSTAVDDILQLCPLSRRGAIWYLMCFLRYSGNNFTSSRDNETLALKKLRRFSYDTQNASEPRFAALLGDLMTKLTERAAYRSARLFATGEVNVTSSERLYGLAQCMRDQSEDDCHQCLNKSVNVMSIYFPRSIKAVTITYSCFMGHATFSFYNESVGAAPPPPPAPVVDSSSPPPSRGKDSGKKNAAMFISLAGALVLLSAIFIICLWKKRTLSKKFNIEDGENKDVESLYFDLNTIRVATDNFSDANKLGQGGFGPVYKGVLSDGQEIAVKRLSRSSRQGIHELKNEVTFVARLEHRNLVKLLGCCLEEKEKLLIYEFLPNRSLDKFLFDPTKGGLLDWGKRYKIIEGIARGLLYLHQDSQLKIIHRDLKTSNILLDQHMNPKIADFGLAKLYESGKEHGCASTIAGTNGYMAPEYLKHGHFSNKSDVFSFGVLVLEILTGRRITNFQGSGDYTNLLSLAWENWNEGKALEIMDHSLGEQYHRQEAMLCIHIGLLCIQEDLRKRPCMETVVLMLTSYSMSLPTPSIPAYFVQRGKTAEPVVAFGTTNSTPPGSLSICNASITQMEPR